MKFMECGCPAFSFLVSERKIYGEVFLMYLIGYGLGRIWIEGLRTDQLLLPVVGLPVSQLLSGCLVVGWYHPGGMERKIIIRWGDSPFLRIKTSEKNRIKIQKKGKPAKKVFSFFVTKLV